MEQIKAPFTPEQVEQLNRYQRGGYMHPFTCPRQHVPDLSVDLLATTAGWVCPDPKCEYVQDWAWAMMADGEYMDRADDTRQLFAANMIQVQQARRQQG